MDFQGFFLTGTDTGVGKTVVSAALLRAHQDRGRRAIGMKPVASGCQATEAGWRNEDALALQAASLPMPEYELVNPFALPDATAPQISAARVGAKVELAPMLAAYRALAPRAEVMLVEGVGGWLAPMADDLDQSALARALDLEVILVVGLRLGCINHARLSERAIVADGLRLRGWIANAADADLEFSEPYFDALRASMRTPCLGRLPYDPAADDRQRGRLLAGAVADQGLSAG